MAQPSTLRELIIVASRRFASDANLYDGNSTGPGTPLRQAEDTASKPNAVLDQLEWLLEQAGYVEGEDYTRESLEQPTPMAELYPAFSSSAQQRNDPPLIDPSATRQYTEYTFCTPWVTEVYWYHPNYLGSVDLVTDLSGHAHQFFMHTAWGEPMFENSSMSGGFDSPYRFNGKELGKETGYGYYGARYYQSKLSMWLSVDPLAHKYPSITPYNFVENNPINLIDPTGLGPVDPSGDEPFILKPILGSEGPNQGLELLPPIDEPTGNAPLGGNTPPEMWEEYGKSFNETFKNDITDFVANNPVGDTKEYNERLEDFILKYDYSQVGRENGSHPLELVKFRTGVDGDWPPHKSHDPALLGTNSNYPPGYVDNPGIPQPFPEVFELIGGGVLDVPNSQGAEIKIIVTLRKVPFQ